MEYNIENVEAIRSLFEGLVKAWNNADGTAWANHFTVDADFVTVNGIHLKGKTEIAEAHQRLFDGPMTGSKLELRGTKPEDHEYFDYRFLTDDIAITHGVGEFKSKSQIGSRTSGLSFNTSVIVHQNGEWRITAFHNSSVSNSHGKS